MALAINSPRLYIAITKFLPALFSELFLRNEVSDYGCRNAMNCRIVDRNFFLSAQVNKIFHDFQGMTENARQKSVA